MLPDGRYRLNRGYLAWTINIAEASQIRNTLKGDFMKIMFTAWMVSCDHRQEIVSRKIILLVTNVLHEPHAKSRLKLRKIKSKIRNMILGMYQQSFYGFSWIFTSSCPKSHFFFLSRSKSWLSTSWECEREMLCTFNNLHFILLFLSQVRS